MLTIEEYKEKRLEADKKVYEMIKDDWEGYTVYVLHEVGRDKHKCNIYLGVFRTFESLQKAIVKERENLKGRERAGIYAKDYFWFRINKYHYTYGEYEDVLKCELDIDGNLLDYKLYVETDEIDEPSCDDVKKLFDDGDIIKINGKPFSESFYAIYIYDDKTHCELTFDKDYYFGKLDRLDWIKKVERCPIEELTVMSKAIKDNKDNEKLFEKMGIVKEFLPF